MERLRTAAWLLRGISSIPGELRLERGVLVFTATGAGTLWPFQWRRLARALRRPTLSPPAHGETAVDLFAWPVEAVRVTAPWYWFGGGLVVRHEGIRLRISFGRPVAPAEGLGEAADQVREVRLMRQRGRQWVAALERARRE
ncbi:MAG: hypothetical protein LCH84_01100 [Gemmatimonadetes bacterium]|nr:hypothetical protein [Gemmatimonadota bacterium]